MLHRSPFLFGLERSRWWLAGLRQVVAWLGDRPLGSIWRVLHRLEVHYKRGRMYVHSPDAEYDQKLDQIRAARHLVEAYPDRYVMVYEDEMTYYQAPSVSLGYAHSGSKYPLARRSHTRNRSRRIAACLDVRSGRLTTLQRERFNVKGLRTFYRTLRAAYPQGQTIFLVQDNWPVHFHPDLLAFLTASRIVILRLPTYAPWTNPVEQVWLKLYRDLLHLHPFSHDWKALQAAIQSWLDQFAGGSIDLLHTVGLYPY